jgi:hypothetical protein
MLGSGTNAVACGEIGGWFRTARYREDATPPKILRPFSDVPTEKFHRRALDYYDAEFVVDSTKSLEWVLEVNRYHKKENINVFNILIWKSPIEYTYSQWKRGINDKLSYRYYKAPFYHSRLFRSGLDFLTVNYESLVREPTNKLKDICRHIGMEYHDGMKYFWNTSLNIAGSSPGVRRQVERGSSSLTMEPHPDEFEPIADRVRTNAQRNEQISHVLNILKDRDVSNVPVSEEPSSHQYNPSMRAQVEHHFCRVAKNFVLRARWNAMEKLRMKYAKYIPFEFSNSNHNENKKNDSFDPIKIK